MRTHKFCAWYPSLKKMVYWDEILKLEPTLDVFFNSEDHVTTPIVKRQYVGIKDTNGKEIYEGDILRFKVKKGFPNIGTIGVVNWSYMSYIIENNTGSYLFIYLEEFEVIGNVFEHAHLLEVY